MNEWQKLVSSLNRAGFPPAIMVVIGFMFIILNAMLNHTDIIKEQISNVHAAQLADMARNDTMHRNQQKMLLKMDRRITSLETRDQLLGLPIYQEKGKTYLQDERPTNF